MRLLKGSYTTYTKASLHKIQSKDNAVISANTLIDDKKESFVVYTFQNCIMLIKSVMQLLFMLFAPYMIFLFIIFGPSSFIGLISILLIIIYFSIIYAYKVPNQYGTKTVFNLYGSSIPAGLYYDTKDSQICNMLQNCPVITSKEAIHGSLPIIDSKTRKHVSTLYSTWWMLTGDMRTLIPFLTNKPKDIEYIRQWIRVPALKKEVVNHNNYRNKAKSSDKNVLYEAVALDWAVANNVSYPDSKPSTIRPKTALLLLAGLTGGSKEGYILDVVNAATEIGWDCYIMVGRGLAGTPLESGISFHGARIEDITECAKVIRQSHKPPHKLFLVGISMGAIIAANAAIRGDICSYVDGVVCVSCTFDTTKNSTFEHSRKFWQPFLALGLKEAFFTNKIMQLQLQNKLQDNYNSFSPVTSSSSSLISRNKVDQPMNLQKVLDGLVDVYDFDCIVVTNLHQYDNVDAYYQDMSPTKQMIYTLSHLNSNTTTTTTKSNNINDDDDVDKNVNTYKLTKPCLILHAIDDPILHVDTLPWLDNKRQSTYQHEPTKNMIYLVTSNGGHVGWPLSSQPWKHGFKYISSIVIEFCNANNK